MSEQRVLIPDLAPQLYGSKSIEPSLVQLGQESIWKLFFFQGRDLGDPGVVGSGKEVTAPKKKNKRGRGGAIKYENNGNLRPCLAAEGR